MPEILPFMVRDHAQHHITDQDVSVPPALTITDEAGSIWTLGFRFAAPGDRPRGEFAFNVLRDGQDTGVMASRLERHKGRVRAYTATGWQWLHVVEMAPVLVHAIGVRCTAALPPYAPEATVTIQHPATQRDIATVRTAQAGAVVDLSGAPFPCPPSTWLEAVVTPVDCLPALDVVAYLGGQYVRRIRLRAKE